MYILIVNYATNAMYTVVEYYYKRDIGVLAERAADYGEVI